MVRLVGCVSAGSRRAIGAVTMLLCSLVWVPWSSVAHGQADTCLLATEQGVVRGIDRGKSCEFRAVPFGASTAGARRWMPPRCGRPMGTGRSGCNRACSLLPRNQCGRWARLGS